MGAVMERTMADDKPLDYEGSVEPERIGHDTLFGDAGIRVSEKVKETSRYLRRLDQVMEAFERVVVQGETGRFREAMQTSDFPLVFGDVLDRQMVGRYEEYTPDWRQIAKVTTLRDFRTVKRFGTDGMEGALNAVGEQKEYPKSQLAESTHSLTASKYGRQTSFSWEAMVNDDFEALQDTPDRFARAARRTEARAVTALYVGVNGPLATVYHALNGNIITGNPLLSIAGLQTAMGVFGNMRDTDGEPILIETVILEVTPADEVVARNILNATQIVVGGQGQTGGGGVAAQAMMTNNWMRNRVQLVVNPYIPILASSTNTNTTWFMHAAKSSGRAPFEVGFLKGYERPQIFQKLPDQQRVGGAANFMDGDFMFDTLWWKVRHCLGATFTGGTSGVGGTGGQKLTIASNGSGS